IHERVPVSRPPHGAARVVNLDLDHRLLPVDDLRHFDLLFLRRLLLHDDSKKTRTERRGECFYSALITYAFCCAAFSAASKTRGYVPQRQKLPLQASRSSSSVGCGFFLR